MGASAGRVLLIPKGDWNTSTTYTGLDWVRHNGAAWVCKNTCTNIEPTLENTDNWQMMARDGDMVTADTAMSDSSTNAVQNKVIKSYVDNSIAGIADMTGATATQNGAHGFVPAPQAGDEKKVLLGDGTWGAIDDKFSFSDHDTATSGTSFTDAEDGNMLVTDWTKNLLNPTLETTTQNGVTCTNNGDGTYTLNGRCNLESGRTSFLLLNDNRNTKYIKDIKYVGNTKDSYEERAAYLTVDIWKDNTWVTGGDVTDEHGILVNDIIGNAEFNLIRYIIHVNAGKTCDNVLIKPMLTTDLSATYDDFVPYGGYEIQSCGKNLLNNTLETHEINGVTCTNNGDGTYTLNGTASGDCVFWSNTDIFIKKGTYKFVGTPPNISGVSIGGTIYGNVPYEGVVIDKNDDVTGRFAIVVQNGAECVNAVFKPMLTTDLSATYDDFEPYTVETVTVTNTTESPAFGLKSHKGITNIISPGNVKCVYPTNESGKGVLDSLYNKDKMLTEQNESLEVLGKCKNLLNPTLQTTASNGVTCTNNGDGTYTLNGTASGISAFNFYSTLQSGKYKAVGCPSDGNLSTYTIQHKKTNNNGESLAEDSGNGEVFELSEETLVYSYIRIASGYTCDNLIFKPMITTNLNATYDDFVPYTGDGETLASDVAEISNELSKLKNAIIAMGGTV